MKKSIALICDDNYVMPTAVTIQSIKDSYKGKDIVDIFICTFGLSKVNYDYLNSLSSDLFNIKIHTSDKGLYQKYTNQIIQKSHVTPTSLLKFELPNIFFNIDTLLYIDSDIVIKGNIEDVFKIEMSNFYLAAVPEIWYYLNKYLSKLDYHVSSNFYFNSGVILFNLNKMREDNIPVKLWERKIELSKNAEKKLMDQDALNDVCASKALVLPVIWNLNVIFTDPKVIGLDVMNNILGTSYKSHNQLLEGARILHYVGKDDKPWLYSSAHCVDFWDIEYKKVGLFIDDLNRTEINHTTLRYLGVLKKVLKEKGVLYTIRYIYSKITARIC